LTAAVPYIVAAVLSFAMVFLTSDAARKETEMLTQPKTDIEPPP
jgi:hypothetical protein